MRSNVCRNNYSTYLHWLKIYIWLYLYVSEKYILIVVVCTKRKKAYALEYTVYLRPVISHLIGMVLWGNLNILYMSAIFAGAHNPHETKSILYILDLVSAFILTLVTMGHWFAG